MIKLYFDIIEFVCRVKKLELTLRINFEYKGSSIFRGKIDGIIPSTGIVLMDKEEYQYFFHGTGITFTNSENEFEYNHYAGRDGLGIYFTPWSICKAYNYEINENIIKNFKNLLEQNVIQQWMPEIPNSQVYYLV